MSMPNIDLARDFVVPHTYRNAFTMLLQLHTHQVKCLVNSDSRIFRQLRMLQHRLPVLARATHLKTRPDHLLKRGTRLLTPDKLNLPRYCHLYQPTQIRTPCCPHPCRHLHWLSKFSIFFQLAQSSNAKHTSIRSPFSCTVPTHCSSSPKTCNVSQVCPAFSSPYMLSDGAS